MQKLKDLLEWGGTRRDAAFLVFSGAALLLSIFAREFFPIDPAWAAILLCGVPILLEAVIGLVTAFDIKADLLVSLALIASVCIGETFAAGEVAFIMQLGGLLEEQTVARARAGIERLVRLTPRTARVLRGGRETVLPAEQVQAGDLLRVLPGETVPVDGIITQGQTTINQAVMTGESIPVDKGIGDEVSSGTVNQFGSFEMQATRVGEDSSIQRMIRLVQSADAGKAKIVGLADRWATWIVVIALSAVAITGLITGQMIRAVTILVVFCPCALVLATPTAIMAAIGNATRHGFLVREGDALERLATVKQVAFDKTGTLTRGEPNVVAVVPFSNAFTEAQLYALAASAELRSEHPLGKAVVRCFGQQNCTVPADPTDFVMLPGQGVQARVGNLEILAGNPGLLARNGANLNDAQLALAQPYREQGCTLIYLAVNGQTAGLLALADTLRPDAASTIDRIRSAGALPVLLTGDHEAAARHIAGQLGIKVFRAECLPEDKLNYIWQCQNQAAPVCMVGDGVNDAPALKLSQVGIAMGGMGSDIAVDAADIALIHDDLSQLPHLLRLSRRMMTVIRRNLAFSLTLNLIAIVLAITGVLTPVVGALVHNAGSVFVILNSALLLNFSEDSAGSLR